MRTVVVLLGLGVFAGGMALPQANSTTAAKKKSSPTTGKTVASPKTAPKTAPATTATRKTTPVTTKTAGKTATKTTGKATKSAKKGVPAAPRRYGPMAPTPERYRDIQSALAEKGYLKTEPNGVWDNDSVDAMKRFQEDKNLSATGKITASALIGLGLGPKIDADPVVVPAATPPVTPPTPAPLP
jgi:hypothetical protein